MIGTTIKRRFPKKETVGITTKGYGKDIQARENDILQENYGYGKDIQARGKSSRRVHGKKTKEEKNYGQKAEFREERREEKPLKEENKVQGFRDEILKGGGRKRVIRLGTPRKKKKGTSEIS